MVRLKNGFINALDYLEIFKTKLFELALSGDLKDFCTLVQDNDIRIFYPRKRMQTVKLTPSFAINNYSYFTPLLVAVQKGH